MDKELWDRLTKSAQQVLVKEAEVLAGGFSGTIELQCYKGGVRLWRVVPEFRPPSADG